jgi:hypothetical protein
MSVTFECNICCSDVPLKKRVECPLCKWVNCTDCQVKYGKSDCSSCHGEFNYKFIVENLGTQFITKVVKPNKIDELLKEIKSKLHIYEPLVQWEREVRDAKNKKRFGIQMTLPERPKLNNLNKNNIFPCPYNECRGFITDGICGTCKCYACKLCHEKKLDENHICKVEDLQSIAKINSDTKPCPNCKTSIHRTMGCNHMFCTHCRTHFDWVSGSKLANSTNGHYVGLVAFAQNVATFNNNNNNNCNDEHSFSLFTDRVQYKLLENKNISKDIITILYDNANTIRLMKRKLYNEPNIIDIYNEAITTLAIKYLLNDINEKQLGNSLYNLYTKNRLHTLYANVLNIYLEIIDNIQIQLLNNNINHDQIRQTLYDTINLCNTSFASINEEFGGHLHKIRNINEPLDNPAFI